MWLKMYYQDPLITKCADKYAVKEYVKELIGEKYVVKTLASWENPEEHASFNCTLSTEPFLILMHFIS